MIETAPRNIWLPGDPLDTRPPRRDRRRLPPWREYGYGYPCCCEDCEYCDGSPPDEFSITIAGLSGNANPYCANCTNYNGTFVVGNRQVVEMGVGPVCLWHYEFPGSPPCQRYLVLRLTYTGGQYHVWVFDDADLDPQTGYSFNFGKTYASKPACSTFNNESLTLSVALWQCDGPATCLVTAL